MARKVLLCLLVVLGAQAATYCKTYLCDTTLQTNVCATRGSSSTIKVNSNGCDSTHYCAASGMISWAENNSDTSTSIACSQVSTTTTDTSFVDVTCLGRQLGKNFATGSTTPIACDSAIDCKLADGNNAVCACALRTDGYGICVPDNSNTDIFQGYWDECGSDGKITSEDAAVYWTAYMGSWVYYNTDLPCKSVFSEYKAIVDADDNYSAAGVLAVGLAALVY